MKDGASSQAEVSAGCLEARRANHTAASEWRRATEEDGDRRNGREEKSRRMSCPPAGYENRRLSYRRYRSQFTSP